MTAILYGRPPVVFDPPTVAVQVSPLIPGSAALEALAPGSVESATLYAPPGAVERRAVLALALRALKPGGRLDVMAPKDKGGARLKTELQDFGIEAEIVSKAHHKRALATRPETVEGLEAAIEAGAPRRVAAIDAVSRPGVFAWDRLDAGTALMLAHWAPVAGAGADLGCGWGALSRRVLEAPGVSRLRLVDLDRRAVEAAQANIDDARATFEWADARSLTATGDLDFVVMNAPFHDGGTEDRRLGQGFVRTAAGLLRKGGRLRLVANRHLPYEADLSALFARVTPLADTGGYKLIEAVK